MSITRREHLAGLAAAGLTLTIGGRVSADSHAAEGAMEHVVEMRNSDPDNPRKRQVFVPEILQVNPGDTVKFVSADPGHNSEVDEDMMPEGGTMWEGKINEDITVTIDVEGAYGYYCTPHRTAGMVGLILVGSALENYEALKDVRQRGQAGRRWEEIFEQADSIVEEARSTAS